MSKTILITGATDGIGFVTAEKLITQGHHVLLHGRNPEKLEKTANQLCQYGTVETYLADLSDLQSVATLAENIKHKHRKLDVLINNAGVFHVENAITTDGYDVRLMVNCIAPYLLTKSLLPLLGTDARIVNLSSAAQASVDLSAFETTSKTMQAMQAYSQSKLAIIMWSRALVASLGAEAPIITAVNPGSLLGSKMVKEGFGIEGKDLSIGANILIMAALSDEFANASGKYFDNDSGHFTHPHADALDPDQCQKLTNLLEKIITTIKQP